VIVTPAKLGLSPMVVTLVAISLLGGGLLYVMFRWIRDEVRNRKIRRLIRTYRLARTVHL
jgi:hypothetical protein